MVDSRSEEANKIFNGLMTFTGFVYSGANIAILSFISARISVGVPVLAVASFVLFSTALVTFAVLYQVLSQLISRRQNTLAEQAHLFFFNEAHLEDLFDALNKHTAPWLFKTIFWLPMALTTAGFICGALAVFRIGPVIGAIANAPLP